MKKLIRILGILFSVLAVGLLLIFLIAWRSPAYYEVSQELNAPDSIVPFRNYDKISDHPRPLILKDLNKRVTIFGATHTRDPKALEISLIEKEWDTLKPTIALVEGRLGFLLPGIMDPVSTLGEGGKVKELAEENNVPIYNWDLSKSDLMKQLVNSYSAEQVALAQILNPYFSNLRFGKPTSPESFVEGYLKRAAEVDQQENFKSVQDVDRIWKKYFPDKDWRDVSDEYGLPGYLSDMMAISNDLRNQHLLNVVNDLVAKGERVFLQCGSSHAACVAPVFNAE